MLTGTADPDRLAAGAATATIDAWHPGDTRLEGVTSLQLIAELRRAGREELLPPGLHPTDPPSLHIHWWQVADSPWGPFTWCHTRLSCRSGARARALTTAAVVDQGAAAAGLGSRFGFPVRVGDVRLGLHYDRGEANVSIDGAVALQVTALDPTPLPANSVQATSTMNLARTPLGLRLVQVEVRPSTTGVERVRARVGPFDAMVWGDARLDPYHVVSAVVVHDGSVTLPAVRFVCRPDLNAFEGTERVEAAAAP